MVADEGLAAFVSLKLGFSQASWEFDVPLPAGLEADLVLRHEDGTLYVVEAKMGRDAHFGVAQLLLLKAALLRSAPDARVVPVLAVRQATDRLLETADVAGVRVVEVPSFLLTARREPGEIQLTTPKSWDVVAALARHRAVKSLRTLATESGVSLGWVHRVVKELEARGIATASQGGVVLSDAPRLLDAAALERPLKPLLTRTLAVDAGGVQEGARRLTRRLEALTAGPGAFAFCAHTAAGMHSGYARRHDSLEMYVADWDDALLEAFSPEGIPVLVYAPDRSLDGRVRTLEEIRVTDWSLTLLDLCGLGWSARDVALKLMERNDAA